MIRLQIGSGKHTQEPVRQQHYHYEPPPYFDSLEIVRAIEELRHLQITDRLQLFHRLEELRIDMSKELDDLTVAITKMTDTVQTAISTMNGLAAQQAGHDDPVKLVALTTAMNKAVTDLQTAIVATTTTPSA